MSRQLPASLLLLGSFLLARPALAAPPTVVNDRVPVAYLTPRTFAPLSNDTSTPPIDPTTLDLNPAQEGVQRTLSMATGELVANATTGQVTFTPNASALHTEATFTYQVRNTGGELSGTATVTLIIAGRPFPCSGEFYQISQLSSGNTTQATLFRITRSTTANGDLVYGAQELYPTGVTMNGLALSGQDGYLYAIGMVSPYNLYRMSQEGNQNLGPLTYASALVSGEPARAAFNSATADNVGNFYLANNITKFIYRVNLATQIAETIQLDKDAMCGDIAFSPTTGLLYASRYPNNLYSIDLASSSAIKPVNAIRTTNTGGDMGSIFFDPAGNLFGAINQGSFMSYNLTTGATTVIGTANSATQGDGASCVFPPQRLDVVTSVGTIVKHSTVPGRYFVPLTIRVKNTSGGGDPNVQLNNFLWAAGDGTGTTFPGAQSVSIATAPQVSGDLPASALRAGFTGQGSNTALLVDNVMMQAGQTATITYTVQVDYGSGTVPAQAYNTVYASSTVAGPNAGYLRMSNGTLVPPYPLVAADASTPGNNLPASANSDAAAPTPVEFGSVTVLPVELTSFDVRTVGTSANLTWATASEKQNDYFDVERSADGTNFVAVGRRAGAGTSTTGQRYAYQDAEAARHGRLLYYRLRQVDQDGTTSFSPVRAVTFGATDAPVPRLSLMPNPTAGATTLNCVALPAAAYTVRVLDLTGRVLLQAAAAAGESPALATQALPAGTYVVTAQSSSGVFTARLVKQ